MAATSVPADDWHRSCCENVTDAIAFANISEVIAVNETPTPTPKEEPVPGPSIDDPQTPDHVPELPPMRDPQEPPPRSQRDPQTPRSQLEQQTNRRPRAKGPARQR
jgi:hypothetical protein